jgi:hypothetical protein
LISQAEPFSAALLKALDAGHCARRFVVQRVFIKNPSVAHNLTKKLSGVA